MKILEQIQGEPQNIKKAKNERLFSLDTLRGFDMFWITGGGELFAYIGKITGAEWITLQMDHAEWIGFHLYDLIFPLFMFLSGVAIPYAIVSKLEKGLPRKPMVTKVFKRMVLLVLLGIIYNKGLQGDLADIRFASVLGQIGVAYFIASMIIMYTSSLKSRVLWLLAILSAVAFLQLLVPVPGFGAGVLTPQGSINGFVDRLLLPGELFAGTYDPEGLLCIVSATGITLMGTFAGNILRVKQFTEWEKIGLMSTAGLVLIIIAIAISPFYPIIKKCWTGSFVLLTGGISFLLMALFFMLIDVLLWKRWSFYFRVIGMNSIFIFLFVRFVNINILITNMLSWSTTFHGEAIELFSIIGKITFIWGLLYCMYKKEIFLKI
ncbi:MAG: DUF5009 domain-containing protein [Desulforhopalus sp.]